MIDLKQIQHLERLARIRLTDKQRETFREEISRILEYMERLSAADAHAMSEEDALDGGDTEIGRVDDYRPSLARDALLASSPNATDEYMSVPRAVQ